MSEPTVKSPFNGPLETGVRSLAILTAAFPMAMDLQRLVEMDYLVVHSEDAKGPSSLHAPLPLRAGELLVRRGLIESGLKLMVRRGLLSRIASYDGFSYIATDSAQPFVSSLTSNYSIKLLDRAKWAYETYGSTPTEEVLKVTHRIFKWTSEFQVFEQRGVE
ncbi:ABC-three component system middle component 2 [Pseudomonas sp. B22(2017)]|uniref:ABC-three component system middle component 2 n=1 Tax=Pseudomonas sp. B22(2017) TaxID=1981736 RepID=UPI000A1FDAEC|nr:ABC-three component system middle component 2 [Pseudomonas sp. B22(2017)]